MGFEPIPVAAEEQRNAEDVENSVWEQVYATTQDHLDAGRITSRQSTLIILAIGLAILAFPVKIAAAVATGTVVSGISILAAARTELQNSINEIFNRHGLESDINLGN